MIDRTVPRRRAAPLLLLLVAALALLAGCGSGAPPAAPAPPVAAPATAPLTPADAAAWLDGLVPAALDRSGIAGAVVVVVRDGQVVTSRGYGVADTASARPVDVDDTLFRVGSVSKVFTATAVLQLVEQGRIDLDADVRRYLDFPLPLRFEPPVTMRHLLTHTAGFEERLRGLLTLGEGSEDLRATLAVDPPEQVFAPGTTPAYSNYGYGLAGYVVQRVSGMPFDEYVQRNVLDRAGMASSSFAQPLPTGLRGRLSQAYGTSADPAAPFETVRPAPAGSLAASPADMGRFMIAELAEPGSLLAPATRDLMRRPGLDAGSLGALAEGPRMALGLFDESRNGRRIVGHGGDTQFFHSHLQLYPEERTGVFVTTNSSGRGATDTLDLRQSVLNGFADRYFPGAGATTGSTDTAVAHAAAAAGTYESARAPFSTFLKALGLTGPTTLTPRPDGTLVIAPGPLSMYPAVYHEVRPWVWQEIGGQRLVTMQTDGDRVTAIGFESAFSLLPVPPGRAAAIPVLAGSVAVLLIGLLARPAAGLVRRRYGVPTPVSPSRADRTAMLLTRTGAACALVAFAGWFTTVRTAAGLTDVADPVLWGLTGLQAVGVVAIVPAAVALASAVRHRSGPVSVGARLLLLLALVGAAWFALTFGLVAADVSY